MGEYGSVDLHPSLSTLRGDTFLSCMFKDVKCECGETLILNEDDKCKECGIKFVEFNGRVYVGGLFG